MSEAKLYIRNFVSTASEIWTAKKKLVELYRRWLINARTRRLLTEMDAHQLKDIGITRAQAIEEAEKSFWKT